VRPGEIVPELEAVDQDGKPVTLTELVAEGPVVLFFYPKAMTPGCTKESCHFRDLKGEFEQLGAQAVGISDDPPERQREFDQRNDLGLRLLSDPQKEIAGILGAKRVGPLPNRRITYVIDSDRTLLEVIKSEVAMDSHADRALEVLAART
jgi:peroxiredoxin Q/BCP